MSEHRPYDGKTAGLLAALALLLRLLIAPSYGSGGVDGDLIEQKQAVHLALNQGFHEIYRANAVNDPALTGRDWEGGYFTNYPPVIHYLRAAPGWVYRLVSPEGFALWPPELNYLEAERTDLRQRLAASRGFTVALKLPGILADVLLTLGLLAFVSARAGRRAGKLVASAYALNPGILWDTAHWGQHDSVAVGCLVLGLVLILRGRLEAGWAAAVLGGLSKPQTNAFWPLLVALGLARFPPARVAFAGLAALVTAGLVFLPFALGGTLRITLDALYWSTLGGEPFLACYANNLWWLATGGRGYEIADNVALLGPLTARDLGIAAFLVACAACAWRLRGRPDPDGTLAFLGAAVVGMSFFSFATELHENHMMAVLPLLAFASAADRRLLGLFGVVSASFFLNMALFEEELPGWLGFIPPVRALSVANAAVNTLAFLVLWWLFWRRTKPT